VLEPVAVAFEARISAWWTKRSIMAAAVTSRPRDRVKTDKRDVRGLASLHAAGLLSEIFVPCPEHEALRDLIRAGEDARLDRMRARHRLGKFCLRHERCMPTSCWGTTRRA
jgi:hypothetical protein